MLHVPAQHISQDSNCDGICTGLGRNQRNQTCCAQPAPAWVPHGPHPGPLQDTSQGPLCSVTLCRTEVSATPAHAPIWLPKDVLFLLPCHVPSNPDPCPAAGVTGTARSPPITALILYAQTLNYGLVAQPVHIPWPQASCSLLPSTTRGEVSRGIHNCRMRAKQVPSSSH